MDPRKRAHHNGRCLFEGQCRKGPDAPTYNSKDGHWVRGRTAMAAVPNQGNAVECMNLKGGRTAMAAFPDQVGDWQGRRMWYGAHGRGVEEGAHRNGRFP